MVGDHQSFHDGSLEQVVLQLRSDNDDLVLRGVLDSKTPWTAKERHDLGHHAIGTVASHGGKVVVSTPLSGPGYSWETSRYADLILITLRDCDARINDPAVVKNMFDQAGLPPPKDPNFSWIMQSYDLALIEERSGFAFGVVKGDL